MAVERALFVSIEGGEGAGKSLQARTLVAHLKRRSVRVRSVREPGGTVLGERIREVLLFAKEVPLGPEAQALLFSAARAQLVRDVIRPALVAGTTVVADRFFDSTLAYQGYGNGGDLESLRAVTRFAVGMTVPDLTFLLDLPVDTGIARRRRRPRRWDRFESNDMGFHERVRAGYRELAAAEPHRFIVVDATGQELDIARTIAARVDKELFPRAPRIAARP